MYIQLCRPNDPVASEPVEFQYIPHIDGDRKRPRASSPPPHESDIAGVDSNAPYCPQSENSVAVQQNYGRINDIEQLYKDIPELKKVKFNPKGKFPDFIHETERWPLF